MIAGIFPGNLIGNGLCQCAYWNKGLSWESFCGMVPVTFSNSGPSLPPHPDDDHLGSAMGLNNAPEILHHDPKNKVLY